MSEQSNNQRVMTPDFKEWMDLRLRALKSELNCVSIGTIKEFDAATQTATIQVNFLRVIKGFSPLNPPFGDQATDYKLPYPLLIKCPVMVLSGGNARITFPISSGDTCIVLFADKDIDTWFTSGQINIPNSERTHDFNDAIAIVGIRSMLNKLTDYSSTDLEILFPGGVISVRDKHDERLAQTGDVKSSIRTTNHSGWLILDGKSIGKDGSGADYEGEKYRDLFNFVKSCYPNSGSESFDAGNTVDLPDARGRSVVGVDNMGGSSANVLTAAFNPNRNVLGGFVGEQTHTLTIPEMPSHHHTYTYVVSPGAGDSGGALDTYSTANTGDTGGDQPHQNVQPGIMLYLFVKI